MGVGDLLGLDDVHVFVDGDAIRAGEAHGFDILGGVAADEEGTGDALFAQEGKEAGIGFTQEGGEHVRGNLGDERIHGGNDVAAGLDVIAGHILDNLGAVGHERLHALLVVVHVHEDVRAAQMRGQGEGAENQTVHGHVGPGGLEAAHDVESERNAPVLAADALMRDDQLSGQRMRRDRGGRVVVPGQLAAQYFGLHLQVEHGRHAVRQVLGLRLEAAGEELVGITEHFLRRVAFKVGDL